MVTTATTGGGALCLDAADLDGLLAALAGAGYRVIGPTVRDGAIVLDELRSAGDLPFGWGVSLQPGGYRKAPSKDSQSEDRPPRPDRLS